MITIIKENLTVACKWCGETALGNGCPHSPHTGAHESVPLNANKCVYCGTSAYGHGCPYSRDGGLHRHGSGKGKCVWCGSTSVGRGCPYSPTGRHEK